MTGGEAATTLSLSPCIHQQPGANAIDPFFPAVSALLI
jgi:hypothetical protein